MPEKSTSDTLVYVFKCDNALLFKFSLTTNFNSITLSNIDLPQPVGLAQ